MARPKARSDGLIERTRMINGKQMHFYGHTVKEAQAKMDEAIKKAAARDEKGPPFEEVANKFWDYKEPRLKYGTQRGYRRAVNAAKDWFSGAGMKEITTTDISRRLSQMAAQGKAYKTIANQRSVISLVYQFWCTNMDGDRNPCDLIRLPQGLPQTKRHAPTDAEIEKVKAHTDGFGLCAAFAMYAGLRLGEIMALQKRDLSGGKIHVTKAVVWHANQPHIEPPKTASAVRVVPILAPLAAALEGRLGGLADDDYIFGGNAPMTSSKYVSAWLRYCAEIGCTHDSGRVTSAGKKDKHGKTVYKHLPAPDFTAHQLRHEFASVLTQCDVSPQVAKELMGHADITTTQKWYAEAKSWAIDDATRALNAHYYRKNIVNEQN